MFLPQSSRDLKPHGDFNPDRTTPAPGEQFACVSFGAGYIGEYFAYAPMKKTGWSTMFCLYEFDLIDEYFPTVKYRAIIHTLNMQLSIERAK